MRRKEMRRDRKKRHSKSVGFRENNQGRGKKRSGGAVGREEMNAREIRRGYLKNISANCE